MDDVRGLILGMPHGTTPAAVTGEKSQKNILQFQIKRISHTMTKINLNRGQITKTKTSENKVFMAIKISYLECLS